MEVVFSKLMQIMKGGCSGIISWAIRGKDGKRISDDGPIDYPEAKMMLFPKKKDKF